MSSSGTVRARARELLARVASDLERLRTLRQEHGLSLEEAKSALIEAREGGDAHAAFVTTALAHLAAEDALPAPTTIEPAGLPGRPYLNLYRFGSAGPAPLVVYLGGAVTPAVYEARRASAPTVIAAAFDRARRAVGGPRVDLAISPCPLDDGGDPEGWVTDLLDAVVAQLGAPTALGCVGYSAGAGLSLRLATLEDARAAAVFGGSGVARVLEELEAVLARRAAERGPLPVGWWMNLADPLGLAGTDWIRRFATSIALVTSARPGQHPFADYDANGSVEAAFRFVLEHLVG